MELETFLTDKNFTYEDLAKTSQRFFADRPVVVLGTGATIPHGLPSMSELADSLLGDIKFSPPGWEEFAKRLDETKDLEQSLHDVPLPGESVEALVRVTWEIVSSKDTEFYGSLLQESESFPLADMFRYLLRTADAHLRVVTTNYDRLAEYAANHVGAYASTGVTPGWLQRFVPTTVTAERPPSPGFEGQVTILKVHGSLDWFRDATDDVVAIPLSQYIPPNFQPLVVTPGVSKYREVHKDPFRTVMTAADSILRDATCYVCVGYGFNDEHVQPILVNRVNKSDIPLLVLTRTLTNQVRTAFLSTPPKRFLFLEKADRGTKAYTPDHPGGIVIENAPVWQLDKFMDMITGK